jgi:hypothetical protein
MSYVIGTSLGLLICCVLLHYEALRLIGGTAAGMRQPRHAVLVVIFGVVCAHILEMVLYSLALWLGHKLGVGTLTGSTHLRAAQYFYLSAEVYTTLGLGDIYPTGDLRLIAALEPLVGMLLIGWSGSYTYLAVQRYWPKLNDSSSMSLPRCRACDGRVSGRGRSH